MASYEKTRTKIFSPVQHILAHTLDELAYSNLNLPSGISDAKEAMDWLFNVVYPKSKPSVDTPALLPTGVDTPTVGDIPPDPRDMRFVNDDGDGNAALYQWEKYDGDAAYEWKKIADMDWGVSGVVSALIDQTQPLYLMKLGATDYDLDTELPYTGDLAGQHLYGGDTAGQNLILHANNGDDPLVNTGSIFFDDKAAPLETLKHDFGSASNRWLNGYFGSLVIGTSSMTITSGALSGSITDTSGELTFASNNMTTLGNSNASTVTASTALVINDLTDTTTITAGQILSSTNTMSFGAAAVSTTGTLGTGVATLDGDIVIADGSITSLTNSINFGTTNLSTSGTLGVGALSTSQLDVDSTLRIDGNSISILLANTDLALSANGTGIVDIQSEMDALDANFIGSVGIVGDLIVDDLTLDGRTISSSSSIIEVADHVYPSGSGLSLGSSGTGFGTLFLSGNVSDGTDAITIATLLSLRSILVRDVGGPIQTGDAIFWNGTQFVASNPDSEISHTDLLPASLDADDHDHYLNINGRTGGQAAYGGTAGLETLVLGDNTVNDNRVEISAAGFRPLANGTYDLGTLTTNLWRDIHMVGQAKGMRLEQASLLTIQGAVNATTPGRSWYGTDGFMYIDRGGKEFKVGHNTYSGVFSGAALATPIAVDGTSIPANGAMVDARRCIWQLCDLSNNEEIMQVPMTKTATHVTIASDVALSLPAGTNYRLIGIEI